jgi:hypothetical protein
VISSDRDAHIFPHVRCRRLEAHDPHTHINEGPNGGCGLPEWCDGQDLSTDSRAQIARLARQIEAVKALHHPVMHWARGEANERCDEDQFLWPCPTVRAMASAEEPEETGG